MPEMMVVSCKSEIDDECIPSLHLISRLLHMSSVNIQNLHKTFRPTESLKSLVQGTIVSSNSEPINVTLGIVSSLERGEEEGAVFTIICSSTQNHYYRNIIPITGSLDVSISQHQTISNQLDPIAVEFPFAQPKAATKFMLKFTEELGDREIDRGWIRPEQMAQDIEVVVSDLNQTRDLLAEVNRLKSVSGLPSKESFGWLAYYSSETEPETSNGSTLLEINSTSSNLSTKLYDKFVEKKMKSRFREWTEEHALRIRVGTFNVNGQLPPIGGPEYLSDWTTCPDGRPADILAFGFQELDLSVASLVFAPPKNTMSFDGTEKAVGRDELWTSALLSGLGDEKENYVKLTSKQYVGVLLIVLIRKDLDNFGDVSVDAVPIGLMGLMGNKAGVGVRLRVQGSYITFVNSHLAAFTNQLEKRRMDFEEISKRLKFPFDSDQAIESVGWYGIKSPESSPITLGHEEVGLCFWMGDLNYRIDLPEEEGWELIASKGAFALLSKDQLNLERTKGTHFYGFEEGEIKFPPTFKYEKEVDSFDTRRLPAWCDRILWSESKRESVKLVSYTSHPSINFSDHRPVSASFDVHVRKVNKFSWSDVLQDVERIADTIEHEDYSHLDI